MYPNNKNYVWKWRVKPFHDVVRALKVMEKVDDKWPKAKNLTVVYLLFSKKLKLDVDKQVGTEIR